MRDVSVWVVGVVVLTLAAVPAQAELITINIEGVVDTVDDSGNYLEGQVNPGNIITGWYTYDTATLDSDPLDPVQGNYWHYSPPGGITLSIGELVFQTDPTNVEFRVAIRNNDASGDDEYIIGSVYNSPLPNGTPVQTIGWALKDHSAEVFDDDSLPTGPPNLEYWDSNLLRIDTDRTFMINAHVTSAVPEPVTVLLLAIGATMMFVKKS